MQRGETGAAGCRAQSRWIRQHATAAGVPPEKHHGTLGDVDRSAAFFREFLSRRKDAIQIVADLDKMPDCDPA
jgi:hypothetical protein